MTKTVSASEAKTRFGAVIKWTVEGQEDVIVESHGQPQAVIISFAEYQKLLQCREQARRAAALAEMERLREQVRERNQDLSQEEAEEIADRFSRDVIEKMIQEGKIKYEEQ